MGNVNAYRGEVPIRIGGRDCVLWFGWPGIALLQSEFGENFEIEIAKGIGSLDVSILSRIVAIAVRGSWEGVTPQMIFEASPPLQEVSDKITLSLRRTFHGLEEVKDKTEANPPMWRRLLTRVSAGTSSSKVSAQPST